MARVLVIDDEETYRDYLARTLEHEGYDVDSVADGIQARHCFDVHRPDLVVVDWQLKTMENGVEVFESLRARAPDLPGLLITGYPAESVREAVERADFSGLLEKPFTLQLLTERVHSILDEARSPR